MRLCVGLMMLWIAAAGVMVAQNPPSKPGKSMQRSSVRERVFNSASERLRWEAAQTWTAPELPERNIEPAPHAIHIDQLPLTIPKLRREWLHPSQETALDDGDLSASGFSSLLPRSVK